MSVSSQTRAFRRNKYYAQKVKLDGYTFDSKREAAVYAGLKVLAERGEISGLQVHPRIELHAPTAFGDSKVGEAELDFSYFDTRDKRRHWIDVKGMDLPLSKWKRKHILIQLGIEVEIVK